MRALKMLMRSKEVKRRISRERRAERDQADHADRTATAIMTSAERVTSAVGKKTGVSDNKAEIGLKRQFVERRRSFTVLKSPTHTSLRAFP